MKKILVVLPHPDDEAFGAAGTLAMHVSRGARVTYACLTLGEMGRNMGFPPFANRVTLPQIRQAELEASCRAVGIQDLRLLGFHDKTLEFEDPDKLAGRIGELLEEIRPDLVITFYPGYSVHPDHDACGAAVIRAVGRLPEAERPAVHCMAFSHDCEQALGKPGVVNDVRPFLEQKLGALNAHRSQFRYGTLPARGRLSETEFAEWLGRERFWTYRWPKSDL